MKPVASSSLRTPRSSSRPSGSSQYLRARIVGIVYGALDAKKEAVENELRKLAACREKVRSLTCWDWVEKALTQLAGKQATLH